MSAGDVALYRKYRSASFDTVIGQTQVVETLKNAIAADRLSHAYLFTGPRGVGKTSVARLLARAANCTADDPAQRPCGTCDSCKVEIGSSLDLIEIDAASNRGIDDARALREKITSAPSLGRYKVYIIDEVHMLTTEAFNALLKTLEEPPAHAIFILATTEAHKLPETIISRTQRFSFRPITQPDLVAQLSHIATEEGAKIDESALAVIAHASRGGFRDAISLLDQARSTGASPITASTIRQLLGQSDPEIIGGIITAVTNQQPTQALAALTTALEAGAQATQLAHQLIEHWRDQLHRHSDDTTTLHQAVNAIEALLPVLKSGWPELTLEAAIAQLAVAEVEIPSIPVKLTLTGAPVAQPAPIPHAAVASAPAKPPVPSPSQTPPQPPTKDLWVKALSQIKQHNNSLYALLRSSTTIQLEDDQLVLGCRFSFHRDRLRETKNIQVIEQALARVYGRKIKVLAELEARPTAAVSAQVANTELVSSALEILGGEIIHE